MQKNIHVQVIVRVSGLESLLIVKSDALFLGQFTIGSGVSVLKGLTSIKSIF